MGTALAEGMVLVMSLWDDHAADMLWLDSIYPTSASSSTPGAARGTCDISSGRPDLVESESANAYVIYSNIRSALWALPMARPVRTRDLARLRLRLLARAALAPLTMLSAVAKDGLGPPPASAHTLAPSRTTITLNACEVKSVVEEKGQEECSSIKYMLWLLGRTSKCTWSISKVTSRISPLGSHVLLLCSFVVRSVLIQACRNLSRIGQSLLIVCDVACARQVSCVKRMHY